MIDCGKQVVGFGEDLGRVLILGRTSWANQAIWFVQHQKSDNWGQMALEMSDESRVKLFFMDTLFSVSG
ncbi:hypothetical protein [Desulfoplanes formicivorans]|uniref:hypothetical protein n=1 Tax=Desulfoplanes formicivorans TaxID=1592317 RepID=UPI000853E80D|nr:hypothetical protein [Desulfoplanes formicivorans]